MSSFFRSVAVVASGSLISKIIAVSIMPIVTRLYSVESFGIYSSLLSISLIFGSVANLRYSSAIPIIKNNRSAITMVHVSFYVSCIMSLLSFIIISIYDYFYESKVGAVNEWLWILPILVFAQGSYQALYSWAIREGYFNYSTISVVTRSIFSSISKVTFGWLGFGTKGLILSLLIQEISGSVKLIRKLCSKKNTISKDRYFALIKCLIYKYRKFPLLQSFSQLSLISSNFLPVILIGALFGPDWAGYYALSQSMISLPVDMISQSISQVYISKIGRISKTSPKDVYRISLDIIKKLSIIGVPLFLFVVFASPYLFSFVFGKDWSESGKIIVYLGPLLIIQLVSSSINQVYIAFERHKLLLFTNISRLLLTLGTFGITWYANIEFYNFLALYVVVQCIFRMYVFYNSLAIVKEQIENV
ncbi:lipopolysaccharide biosynthesis protein [Providencia sp. R1]|uniref:lipopolysaccharide biosynthesis protein n=1 Tax=Morganellaceae TaxID=1903414 RepID=UPI001B392BC4|nr:MULTISPECIES: oligosaccharide flippase family protein [Providencia]EJD6662557.1 oligosaccharide flippase family protein [Providencia rettgeri]MBQ0307571.1 oligosaccharide flippase family protein [Providencia rettgeri]